MKFVSNSILRLAILFSTTQAKTTCTPSPKVSPKAQYEFSINLTLGVGIDLGVDIYNARQTFLPIEGGSFCARWNGGVSGTVVVSAR